MAKKKYTPEATIDLLYNQLMSDYKGDAQAEAERQRQKSAERKASGNSTNSSTSVQNTLQSPSAVSRGASAVGNIYKAPKRKYTTGKTTHGYTTARSFAKDQTTKPKTSGTRGIGSATQEAFERGLSSRSLKENVGQRSSLSNKKSYTKESDLNDFSRNRSHNQAKILDKMQAFAQTQRYENELKKQRAEYDRLREEHPTSEWLKEEGWGALTNFNSTLASTADWLLPDVITPKAVQNALDYYKTEDEKQQKKVQEVRGNDPLRTVGGNLGVNMVQNIPAMMLAPLSAGSKVATTAGTLLNPETLTQTGNSITRALYSVAQETGNNPMFWETFLRTAGPTYDKEIESGADPMKATLSALTNGLLNAQIEIGGGIEKFDPTETFLQALARSGKEEGLEEIQQYAVEGLTNKALGSNTSKWFSTKRGEDAVINPIDMAEQGAYGALAGGLMGGGRAGVATLSRSLADAEYNRAFPDSKAHTQDLVEQALMQAREGQKSSEAEILATNIQNMMEQGEEVPTVLVRQLHNEVLRAQAENERDFSERKNEGYQQAVSEGRANTVETQDTEEESRVFRSVADEKAQTYYDTAMDKMGENASEKSARAISKLMVGVHTNQDIDTILIDKNARNAVEEMTGIDLPIKNTDAREILETRGLANMVANRDNMLQETHNVIRSNMRGREGAVFEKNYDNAMQIIGVANAPEIYESVFSRFKNAGMVKGSDFDSAYDRIVSPLTKDFGEELGGRIALVFNRDFARQAFDAGRQAYIADEAKTSAREKAVSAENAGTVTYKHDTESRLSTRQKSFMKNFAERAKVGIEFYDGTQEGEDDSANGYYENGVIHININATNKLITVAKHELTHHIKVTAPEMYRKLEDFVIKKWYNNDPDAFDKKVMDYQRKWNCSVEVAYEEIIANASEAFFTDKGTIDDAVKFSKKLGHTIHDGIRSLLDTFLDIQDTDRIGDRGYGEFLKELNILKESQRMWLEALDQSVNRTRGRNASEATAEDYSDVSTQYTTSDVKHSLVENREEIARLEAEPSQTTYRAMALIGGKLYPPMATKVKGKNGKWELQYGANIGDWLKADITTDPSMFDSKGRFHLKKDKGDDIFASYNPYIHSSDVMLNDQFAIAYKRPNIVVVEGEIPTSEIENSVRTEHDLDDGRHVKAKDPTGKIKWKAGIVQGKLTGTRTVYLTNHFKPTRIVPESEVAKNIQQMLSGTDVAVPYNVVTPSLRAELEKIGVKMEQNTDPRYRVDLGEEELNSFLDEHNLERINEPKRSLKAREDNRGGTISDSQFDFFKNSQAVDDYGRLVRLWHTTKKGGFSIFDREKSDDKRSFFFSDNFSVSQTYARNANKPIEFNENDLAGGSQRGYYEVYLNLLNPLVVDAHDADWRSIPYGEKDRTIWDDASFKVKRFETNWLHNDYKNPRRLNGVYVTIVAEEKDLATGKWHRITYIDQLNTDETDEWKAKKDLEKKIIRWWEERGLSEAGYWKMLDRPEPFDGEWDLDFEDDPVYFDTDGHMLDKSNYSAERYTTRDLAEIAENAGYDGVIIRNVYDFDDYRMLPWGYDGKSDVYIAFQPDQIKLASNETPTDNPDIRLSKKDQELDTQYLDAVKKGDMETAQRMVDEQAKSHGWKPRHGYHGTLAYGFTVFDKAKAQVGGNSGAGFYFSTEMDDSVNHYADEEGADNFFKRRNLAERIFNYVSDTGEDWEGHYIETYEDAEEVARELLNKKSGTYDVYLKYDNPYTRNDRFSTNIYEDIMSDFDESLINRDDYDSDEDYEDDLYMYRDEHLYSAIDSAVRNALTYMDEMYEVVDFPSDRAISNLVGDICQTSMDYGFMNWNGIQSAIDDNDVYIKIAFDDEYGADGATELVRAIIEELGYDAVIDKEVSRKFGQLSREMMTDTEHIIVFHPQQIKSADPVTYDDNGDVIPLSERFNEKNEDIRWSKKDSDGNTLSTEQAEYFKDSKVRDKDGNLLVMYHGTEEANFTVFNADYSRDGISLFFTDSLNVAKGYSGTKRTYAPSKAKPSMETLQKILDNAYDGWREYKLERRNGQYEVNRYRRGDFDDKVFEAKSLESIAQQINEEFGDVGESANYKVYLNLTNPLIIDADGKYWDELGELNDGLENTRAYAEYAKKNGYDGVWFKNIIDTALYASGKERFEPSNVVVAFNSNQVKSVANTNPTKNEDIRYSHKTEHEPLPKARTLPQRIKDRLKAIGADKLGKGGLKAPVQISVRDLRTLWYDLKGSEEGQRLNEVLEVVGEELQNLAGKYRYVSLADALEGTIHYRVDENGKPTSIVLSCKVKNAEYDINFDFTTICAKRAPLQKVLERFIKTEGKNKGETLYDELKLDEEGLYTLRSIMEQEGFDVSCIGCFVEQNRYAQQTQSKTVADDWNKALDEWAKEHGVEITEGFDFQNLDIDQLPYSEIQKGFRQYSALMKGKPTTVENKNKALIEAIPYLRKRLGNSDYASIAGQRAMMAMGNGKTNLYNLLKRGQGDSKQSTPFVPYNGEVALLPETKKGKKIFDYLFGIGGARAQSASDFQIEYVFDYMQLVGDLSARGLPMHMYTKVIECAELLGMCGIKINLSAMCDVDNSVDGEYAGLKKVNGKWVYNISKQSIDYEKAVKLQRKEGYRKNIGIIMVVLSKQHMLKALSDADVRYIIGYHSSKMPPIVARASKMEGATDYTKLNKTNRLNDKGRALFAEAMSQAKGKTELEKYKDALRIFDDLIQTDKLKTRGEVPRRGNEYTRYMSSFKANTADFDVYDDIKKTNDPRATADNYIRYCMENDLVPMYFPFAFHENYYKCEVYDYNVYDNETGEYAPMEAVQNIYPELNIANGETDTKRFMAKVRKMIKRQNKKNAKVEPKYEAVERRAIAELSITGNDYMDMDASGIDHAELEHRVDMTEEAVEERRRSIKEKELNAKTIEYQSTIRKLEKETERLKAEFKRTNKKPNIVETRRQAGRLIQRHASNMSIHKDVTDALTDIYTMYAERGTKAFDDIYEIAERTAVEIVNNISEVHFEGKEEYDQIKDYLKDTQIVVTDEMKRNIIDFNDFRKRYFGKLKLVNGTIGNIDSVYEELAEMFPAQFTDEYINPADQLNHMADVLDSYAPFYETLDGTSEEMQDYVVTIASDLMETAYNLQNKKTFADKKYDEKVKAVKKAREKALANKRQALSELREKYEQRMADAIRTTKAETKAETKAKINEKAERNRRLNQIAKIHARLSEKLLTPSDTKHLPDGYNKVVADVLGMFDFTTTRMEKWAEKHEQPSERMLAMLELRQRLQEYAKAYETGDSSNVDLGMEVDTDLLDIVDNLEKALGKNVRLSDLSSATLEDIAHLFRAFERQLNSYNRAFTEGRRETITQSADKVVAEAKEQKHGKWHTGVMGRVFTSNMNPSDFFTLMGGEIEQLYKNVRKGFDKYEKNLAKAKDFIQDRVDVKTAEKWANHKQTFTTTDGEKITLTDTQLMSLYCLMKREQAQGHIFGQGIVSAPVRVKDKIKAETLDRTRVQPTPEDVTEWLKTLSKDQIKFADAVQKFFVDEISEWGNETSMNLYGYKKFTEKNYFPIQSSQDYLNSNFDAKGNDPTLKNISPTKATVKGANNPLMVDDIFSVFAKHTAQMASYNAYVPSITDFQRVWNYKTESPSGRKTSTQEIFRDTYGDGITRYVTNFFADLNGVYKKNLDISTGDKMFGLFKKSAVGGNLRVLTQQPMAIARAMLIVDPLKLAVSVPKTAFQAKKTYNEMLEHCPIAEWKTWGFYSMDIAGASRDLKNVMIGKDSVMDKVFMNMYGVADNVTWTCIFNACKMQVEAENKGIEKGTPEYWDKVNELASEVFDRTQVVDSPFHRSELMKSQDTGKKYLTMFMAEPTKTINMLNTELTLVARELADKKPGKATARFTRLTATTIANAMLLAVGQSIIDAMRSAGGGSDDDDKGDFEERFKKHWMTNTKDNLNVANMIPLVKDVMSLIDGYGVTRPDMMGIEKCVKAVQRLKKYYNNPDESTYTQLEVMTNTALTFMYVLGVPLTNAKRDLESIALTGAEAVDNPDVFLWYMKNKYQVNKNTQYIWADAYYDALDKGNDATAKKIYNYMISQGLTKKYIQNRKKTWEKHRYGEDSNGTDSED